MCIFVHKNTIYEEITLLITENALSSDNGHKRFLSAKKKILQKVKSSNKIFSSQPSISVNKSNANCKQRVGTSNNSSLKHVLHILLLLLQSRQIYGTSKLRYVIILITNYQSISYEQNCKIHRFDY